MRHQRINYREALNEIPAPLAVNNVKVTKAIGTFCLLAKGDATCRSKLDSKRQMLINNALQMGYSTAQLGQAIRRVITI